MLERVNAGMAALGKKAAAAAPAVTRDLAGLAAVGLISYGAWLVTPAAGFIIAGVLLLAGVILLSRKAT